MFSGVADIFLVFRRACLADVIMEKRPLFRRTREMTVNTAKERPGLAGMEEFF